MMRGKKGTRFIPGLFFFLALGVFLSMFMSSCASIRTRERPDPRQNWVYTVRAGSRATEADPRFGALRYRDNVLGSYFSSLVISESRFDFMIRYPEEPFRGYRRDLDFEPPEQHSEEVFTRRDHNRGWYFAALDQRKRDTPDWWIWVRRENLEAFINPDRIDEFVGQYRLGEITPTVVQPQVEVRLQFSTQI